MKLIEYRPSAHLRPFVKAYRLIESKEGVTNRVLPNTSFALAFRLRGRLSYVQAGGNRELPTAVFSGLRRSARLIRYAPHTSTLVVLFTATGISAFFREPLHALFEKSVALEDLLPATEIACVEEQLAESKASEQGIQVIERFLLSRLQCQSPDVLVTEAIRRIAAEKGNVRIKTLAKQLYISQDAFEKRFRNVVGTSPKRWSGIIRMQTVVREISTAGLLDIALDNGYFDQAHFNKDFKRFTGLSPTEFSRPAAFW
ncbi:MAG: helix-turn-helix transcriptional regulator [Saprospiraceae bacterium]|nr:helix-turn-helix transcriptional regulator [Lewinella sp.]